MTDSFFLFFLLVLLGQEHQSLDTFLDSPTLSNFIQWLVLFINVMLVFVIDMYVSSLNICEA